VKKLNTDKLSNRSFDEVRSQTVFKGEDLHVFCNTVDPKTLVFLCSHLQETFGHLFNECSTKKERYLHFQIMWHQHCSYLLVDKNHQLAQLHLHPSDPVAEQVFKVRSAWDRVKEQHSLSHDTSTNF